MNRVFPDGSAGKESTCTAGDPGSIPGLGSSPGERIGYSLQYKNTEAQEGFPGGLMVKNPPAIWET